MAYNYLEDSVGNKSSKRLWGGIILGIGLIMTFILFGISLFKPVGDSATALKLIESAFITGGSLLGIGIFENISLSKKNDQ